MRCFKAKKRLSAYLDGELDDRRRAMLEDHLRRCSRCAAELGRSREQWAELGDDGPAPSIPPDLWDRVTGALDEAERLPWRRRHREQLLRAACVTACVALGFALGALLSWRAPSTDGARQEIPASEDVLMAEAFDKTAFGLGEQKEGLLRCAPK
jgi:anti-sigma factor RsiW